MMRRSIFTILLCLSLQPLMAQGNSPYSRYGIGLLQEQENIVNRGMGGTSIADNSPILVNTLNPASYASLQLTTYQLGVEGAMFTVRNTTTSNRTGGMGLSYMNVGVPLAKGKAGLSFGISPYSKVSYGMEDIDSIPNVSQVLYDYFGSGGIQKAHIGVGYKYKGLSIGANVGFLFGTYQNNSVATFVDTAFILRSNITNRVTARGISFETGAMYEVQIKENHILNIGTTYSLSTDLNGSRGIFQASSQGDISNIQNYNYTADSIIDIKGKIKIPATLSIGAMYVKGSDLESGSSFWKVGADFISSDWSQYRFYDKVDSFKQSYTLRVGTQYVPEVGSARNFWRRVSYRLGGYYRLEPISLNNTQLTNKAITAGMGVPIGSPRSGIGQLNFSFQLGQRGSLSNGLIRESFSRFGIGITVNDKWFIKRFYN